MLHSIWSVSVHTLLIYFDVTNIAYVPVVAGELTVVDMPDVASVGSIGVKK